MSIFYIWHPTNVTLNYATFTKYGGQIYTVRWQLKISPSWSMVNAMNILKRYCKVRYLVECFISLLILSWYTLLVIVSLTRLSWVTPLKVTRKSPQYDSSGFLSPHQCTVDNFVRESDARWEYVCKGNRFRVWILLEGWHFPHFNTISNPLGQYNCLEVLYFSFGTSPKKMEFEHPKWTKNIFLK